MLSPLANWRESLEKIALAVHDGDDDGDDDEGLEIYGRSNGGDSSVSDRRSSHGLAHSPSLSRSPVANGFGAAHDFEIEQYKAEIKRLQESEAEIKALSVNYAALLKEKEDHISRLNKENGLLKQNLDVTVNGVRNESTRASINSTNALKEANDQSPNRQHKYATQLKTRSGVNQGQNGIVSRLDINGNGTRHAGEHDRFWAKEKELADLLEEKNRSLAAVQATHQLQIGELRTELEKERKRLATVDIELREERKLNEALQTQLQSLNDEKDKIFVEMNQVRNELNEKLLEIKRLQNGLDRHENKDVDATFERLKRVIASLEKENNNLKVEKSELEVALQMTRNSPTIKGTQNSVNEDVVPSRSSSERDGLKQSLQKLENDLKETRKERDKALRELSRLKQHLLDKESEESEKMDEDRKVIEELRETNATLKTQIIRLEKALNQAIANQDELRMNSSNETQKQKEIIEDLNKKIANYMSIVDGKNMELLNLQTALGQYYAEIEAKERLARDLALAREECARFSELLDNAHKSAEVSRREKEDILDKLSQVERALIEGNNRVNKLEEDNAKLRRALEQSMTQLNRMSMDSDYLVDRRIVIKLLVTYFQRNHNKEVLDLMVRMLGFSDEDKQRIGVAQQGAGKGVVRGVLGIPGRLVGGILGGSSVEAHANMASDNQSISDLWVDFLLKETDERERRDRDGSTAESAVDTSGKSPDAVGTTPPSSDSRSSAAAGAPPSFSRFSPSMSQGSSPQQFQGNTRPPERYGSEFSTVPLYNSDSTSWTSRPFPR
ncbi:golgin candidate 3-like [Syzygium oleosum]|uniref:golgin candidate 3-like n=1 Tax=Syzygium oleosum TaxID=219896 RepID=UPI0011D242C1|nr:golgin candidate 3-like [Syzygium oleosum]